MNRYDAESPVAETGRLATASVLEPSVLQGFNPSVIVDSPGPVRAVVVFLLTLVFAGAVMYRYGSRMENAVDASMSNPLVSLAYGLMAYGVIVFFTAYLSSQLASVGVSGRFIVTGAVVVLGVVVFSLSGLGFVVVSTWITRDTGVRDPWYGLVGVVGVSAIAWLLLPFLLALFVWVGIAAVGVGGPARQWLHGSKVKSGTG